VEAKAQTKATKHRVVRRRKISANVHDRRTAAEDADPALIAARRYYKFAEDEIAEMEARIALFGEDAECAPQPGLISTLDQECAAEAVFVASVPSTVIGAAVKLRACLKWLNYVRAGDIDVTEIPLDLVIGHVETTIRGLTRPRVVWDAAKHYGS
jgi:hypothetical protein